MQHLLLILSSILCSSTLLAQPAPHVTTNPKAFTGVFTGTANTSFPLGRTGGVIQYWRRGTDLQVPQLIMASGSRPTRGQTAAAATLSGVELTMASSPITFATMTRDFATNFGTQTTVVFTRKPVNLPALTSASDPNQPVTWLNHDAPFVFTGPHLIVQFDLGTAVGSAIINRPSDAVPSAVASHLASALSCGGTLTASGTGTLYTLSLSGAAPNQPGLLMMGVENVLLGGVPALPFRLDGLGMAGCVLGLDPILTVPFTASGSGSMTFHVPMNYVMANDSDVIHAQVLHASTPAGFATSNTTHSVLGAAGLANYIYNYTADGPQAQFGPYPSNRGAILLFRP